MPSYLRLRTSSLVRSLEQQINIPGHAHPEPRGKIEEEPLQCLRDTKSSFYSRVKTANSYRAFSSRESARPHPRRHPSEHAPFVSEASPLELPPAEPDSFEELHDAYRLQASIQ
jgi:hypothetical protein